MTKDVLGALGPLVVVGLLLPPHARRERPLAPWAPWWGRAAAAGSRGPVVCGGGGAEPRGFLWYTLIDNHVLNFVRHRSFPTQDVPLGTLQSSA